jgi:hypothetical protein
MTIHGWLRPQPGKDGQPWLDGQRKSYDLAIGQGGEKHKSSRVAGTVRSTKSVQ